MEKLRHAYLSLIFLHKDDTDTLTPELWNQAVDEAIRIQQFICDQVYLTRKKDYDNEFRNATFNSEEEKIAVIGELDDVSFVKQIREQTAELIESFKKLRIEN